MVKTDNTNLKRENIGLVNSSKKLDEEIKGERIVQDCLERKVNNKDDTLLEERSKS